MEELQPPVLEDMPSLTVPARPKWRYTQTKEEVEKNEGESSAPSLRSLSPAAFVARLVPR